MMRRTNGLNLPDLNRYLTVHFPTIPKALREPIIIATFTAAKKVASTHTEMLLSEDGETAHTMKLSMLRWLHGLTATEPRHPGSSAGTGSETASNNSVANIRHIRRFTVERGSRPSVYQSHPSVYSSYHSRPWYRGGSYGQYDNRGPYLPRNTGWNYPERVYVLGRVYGIPQPKLTVTSVVLLHLHYCSIYAYYFYTVVIWGRILFQMSTEEEMELSDLYREATCMTSMTFATLYKHLTTAIWTSC